MGEQVLAGRVVVVWGAGSRGSRASNGEAAALAYADAGADVAAVDLDEDEARRVACLVRRRGRRALALTADVTDEPAVRAATAAVVGELGAPHVLHNNVGRPVGSGITATSSAEWRRGLDVNVTGAFHTIAATLPSMVAGRRGAIVNVSSVAALRDTGYDYVAYAAAKAALDRLTVAVALAHAADGIRANAVLPGLIDTPLAGALDADPAVLAARHARSPTGRMGTPEQVASVAVFLASDAAAYVNGVCLPVDGGLSARC